MELNRKSIKDAKKDIITDIILVTNESGIDITIITGTATKSVFSIFSRLNLRKFISEYTKLYLLFSY